ncbi:hypothetical protein WOC76_11455 [Methylocystis sp. IM3]|uniref:hypothetical protein n=1 Tax=unclassified Methylocystis TaxID=2625913 RepID=UPI0026BB1A70
MLKLSIIVMGVVLFNAYLILDKKALLLTEGMSSDGWRRSCTYYRPFRKIVVSRPIHFTCTRFESLS